MDLDFGVTGAGPAERKERTGAGMSRAEKKKVELPLGLSRRVCCAWGQCREGGVKGRGLILDTY